MDCGLGPPHKYWGLFLQGKTHTRPLTSLVEVTFFEYLEKIALYCYKKNNDLKFSENRKSFGWCFLVLAFLNTTT